MARVFVASRTGHREAFLGALGRIGVLHPVPLAAVSPDTPERGALQRLEAARQVLRGVAAAGDPPALPAAAVVDEVLELAGRLEEGRERRDDLNRELRRLGPWGGVELARLSALDRADVPVRLYALPAEAAADARGALVLPIATHPGRRIVAVVGQADPPAGAHELDPPHRDAAAIRAEAAGVEAAMADAHGRLAALAGLEPELAREHARQLGGLDRMRLVRGGLADADLFAVAGWTPAAHAPELAAALAREGIDAAVEWRPPEVGERPPTLLRTPRWAAPSGSLFRTLAIVPGYNEMDVSAAFTLALPVFAGMITGDAGYGLLFLLIGTACRHPLARAAGRDAVQLLVLFGVAALVWGALSGVWFGLTPPQLAAVPGLTLTGRALAEIQLLQGSQAEMRTLLMKICFALGAAHLIAAHVTRLAALYPDARALAELGWGAVVAGMLALIWLLFFPPLPAWVPLASGLLLASGMLLVTGFSRPERPLLPRLGLGFAGALLPLLGAFSDTLSYIRLMAVGLASFYLGSTFNVLAVAAADAASWWVGVPVLLLGHGLNLALVCIAIFAHGVRLNVLEFSTHAGVQWAGVPYSPFREPALEELP